MWKIVKDGEEDIIYAVDYNHKKERFFNGYMIIKCRAITFPAQGLKFGASRYPRDNEIWFWIPSLFYLYSDVTPCLFKSGQQ